MSIAYDTIQIRPAARRAVSVPASLLDRIQKPPLLDRLSRDDTHIKTPAAPFVLLFIDAPLFTFVFV